ncbi:unnamed protein product [Effrenium voratum]|nr:unnamed protein product [Effrenium voratum]
MAMPMAMPFNPGSPAPSKVANVRAQSTTGVQSQHDARIAAPRVPGCFQVEPWRARMARSPPRSPPGLTGHGAGPLPSAPGGLRGPAKPPTVPQSAPAAPAPAPAPLAVPPVPPVPPVPAPLRPSARETEDTVLTDRQPLQLVPEPPDSRVRSFSISGHESQERGDARDALATTEGEIQPRQLLMHQLQKQVESEQRAQGPRLPRPMSPCQLQAEKELKPPRLMAAAMAAKEAKTCRHFGK